jgi:hypothetical protein
MGKDGLNEKGEILTSEPADRFEESLPLLQAEGWSPSTRITSPITSQAKITGRLIGIGTCAEQRMPENIRASIGSLFNNTELSSTCRTIVHARASRSTHASITTLNSTIKLSDSMFLALKNSVQNFPSLFEASFPLQLLLTLRSIQHGNDNKGVR